MKKQGFEDHGFGRVLFGAPPPQPCPFCGGVPQIAETIPATIEYGSVFAAECSECFVRGPVADSQIEAAVAWNSRVPSTRKRQRGAA